MMGPAARMRDRYGEAARAVHLYTDPDSPLLRSLSLEQLWREHMLAQLAVDHGITSRAVLMAIGPRLNRRVMAAFRVYQSELIDLDYQDTNRVSFEPIALETFVDAINAAGATELAQSLWRRYLDFERVYGLHRKLAASRFLTRRKNHYRRRRRASRHLCLIEAVASLHLVPPAHTARRRRRRLHRCLQSVRRDDSGNRSSYRR
jgi:hypothetical protein